jgi:hypothetical protein
MTNTSLHEEIREEIADLEDYAARGVRPPHCRGYRIRVNNKHFVVHKGVVLGREVLELAGLVPPERYFLEVRIRGEKPRAVGLDTQVDLTAPGVERFEAEERGLVRIKVNEHEVQVEGPRATGLQIKEAAIKAGVGIQLDFVLTEELPGGRTRPIGDHDVVVLREGACFVAVAPDDNS